MTEHNSGSDNSNLGRAPDASQPQKKRDAIEILVPGKGCVARLQALLVKLLIRSLESAPKPADMPSLDLARYREMIGKLPAPTDTQIEDFADFVSTAHSWYKHLPLAPPGVVFCFYVDRFAGYDWISRFWGKPKLRRRTEATPHFHYNWMTTEDYRARFGYLAYAAGAGTSFALPTPAGFFHYDDRSPAVYLADGSAYRLPPEVTRAGTAEATAMIHPFSKQDWVWMRWFLDTPQATTQVPDDPEGTAVLSELHGYYTQLRDPALRNSNWREKSEQMMPTFKAMESLIDRQRTLQLDAFVAALTGVRELLHG